MIDFISRIIDLVAEFYKARKERTVKRWLYASEKYHKIRPSLNNNELRKSVDALLRKDAKPKDKC